MTVSKHISLDDDHLEKMKPYLEKHKGNFSSALSELINMAGKQDPHMNSSSIDTFLLNWTLTELDGILVPDNVLDEIFDPMLINSMGKLEQYLKRRFSELNWDIDIVLKYDSDLLPSRVLVEIKGGPQKIKFVASMVSKYLVKNSLELIPLEIKSVVDFNECIKVELSRSNKKEAQKSLITFFGGMNKIIETIKSRPVFWKALVNRHLLSNYNMITIHRNYFEDIVANKVPLGEITLENLAKKPIKEIPLKEMLFLIKEVYETSRVADKVEVSGDAITMFHCFRNKESIEKLKKSLVMLLEANGHLFDAKSAANMIMLRHRPDVGIKINEVVDNLRISSSSIDQELMIFIAFLEGLKDFEDIPSSLTALGRRFGTSLMREYESENNIKNWDLSTFQKVLDVIDSRLNRVSEQRLKGNNLLYTVKKCCIAREGNTFDKHVCHTIRETFKGALNYAFGGRAELDINRLVTHGDNFCEVMIRFQ